MLTLQMMLMLKSHPQYVKPTNHPILTAEDEAGGEDRESHGFTGETLYKELENKIKSWHR